MLSSVALHKKEKMFPAFKVSEEMHAEISRLAAARNRKLMDQIRHLIELGIKVESRYEAMLEEAILAEQQLPSGKMAAARKSAQGGTSHP